MTINRNNNGGDSRAIKVLMEQVSDLQEDLSQVQSDVNSLDNSKVGKDELAQSVETNELTAGSANIGSTTITSEQLASNKVSATDLYSPNADFEYEHANNGYIEDLTTDALTVNGDESVVNLNAQRVEVKDSLTAPNVISEDINATNVTATGRVSANNVATQTANVGTVNAATANITQNLNVNNLNITGEITGLNNVDIVANSIDTPTLDADEITTGGIVTSEVNRLTPSPQLDNNDTYTVELPVFTGTMYLSWKDTDENVIWTATVIGNGKDYSIHWGSINGEVTKLYQYNNHAYIKHNANGVLDYSYHATEELAAPSVWYNYSALDNVVPEVYVHDCQSVSGTVSFGLFDAPLFTGGSSGSGEGLIFSGSTTVENLGAPVLKGQLYNIIDNGETNERFIEGAGKPINAGDDVVAVEESKVENGSDFELMDLQPGDSEELSIHDTNNVIVHALNGNKILIQAGAYSTDDGNTWVAQDYHWPNVRNILVLSNGKILWNVDHTVYCSEDNGISYQYLFEESTGPIVELPNGDVYGFYDNRMQSFGTKDNIEQNGDFVEIIPDSQVIWEAKVIDNSIFIKTSTKTVYKSDDNGTTWTVYSGTVDFSKSFISYHSKEDITVKNIWVIRKVIQFNNCYYLERWMSWYGHRIYYKTTDFENYYLIYDTNDGGPEDLPYISFTKNNITGISYGIDANGNLFTSTDDGNTWTKTTPYNVAYNFIYCDSTGTLWTAGRRDGLKKSTNGGETWQNIQLTPGTQPTIASVIEAPNGNLVAATDGRNKWISTDVGQTWELHSADDYRILNSYIIDGKVWATATWYDSVNKFGIVASEDGIEWTVIDSQDVNLNTDYVQLLIDENGHIYYANRFSKDRGVTWENINGPILKSLFNFERKIVGVYSNFGSTQYSLFYQSIPSITKTLKWNKFAAGVNYENFVAQNIKATGNLEVDGASQFDDDVTVNADLSADNFTVNNITINEGATLNGFNVASVIFMSEDEYNNLGSSRNPSSFYFTTPNGNLYLNGFGYSPNLLPPPFYKVYVNLFGMDRQLSTHYLSVNQPSVENNFINGSSIYGIKKDDVWNNTASIHVNTQGSTIITDASELFIFNASNMYIGCNNLTDTFITNPSLITNAPANYNPLEYCTNMSGTFRGCNSFNQPVTIPDNVTDLSSAFLGCSNFNQPITIGNSVTNLDSTFNNCRSFNQPITIPDNVTSMSRTFNNCNSFNQPITIPNNVIDMHYTFSGCKNFNQPITIPDSVTSMASTFSNCNNFNQPITIPNNVIDMYYTFSDCRSFNQPITIPDNVTSMPGTFYGCRNFNQPITIGNNVTNLDSTFINCSNFNQPIIIPDNVTSMSATFGSCSRFNQPITISDSVTNMSATLSFCYNFNQPITIGNSVTNLVGTFFNCRNLNQPITIPDSVTNMRNMFSGCETLNSSTVPIHISSSIDIGTTSNYIYNCLVNGDTGINWTGRILNDA